MEFSSIFFNECSQLDYASIQIAITRLAEKNDLKKKLYFDFNPPNKSHWSYWLFIKKLEPIEEIPVTNPELYDSIQINPMDNVENIDEGYLELLAKMPQKERERFLLGLFSNVDDGVVYYAFSRERHIQAVTKKPGTIFIGMDFNVDPMTAVLVQYIDGVFYCFDEVFLPNSDTYKMANELKNVKKVAGAKVIPDSTGRNRKTSGQSDFNILNEAGFSIESTHNPFVTDRVNNVNRLFAADQIVIDPKCKKLINDLEKVSWKNNELDQGGKNKHLTHISDCLGYTCWKLDPFNRKIETIFTSER